MQINESGMIFGEFEDNKVFQIEESRLQQKVGN